MKKLMILALSAASLFCVYGEPLEDAVDKVEKMIKRTYDPGSIADEVAREKLKAVIRSSKSEEEKVSDLHAKFPKAFPEAKENLIVRIPVTWKIHSLSLGYDIKEGTSAERKTVDIIKELRQKDAISEISKKGDSGKNTEGKIVADGSVEGAVSLNPLQWGLRAKGSISGHFEASYNERQETSSLWNKKDQQMFQHHHETIRTQIYQANIQNLHLTFSVTLVNQTDSKLTVDLDTAYIPVYMDTQSCNDWARPFRQHGVLELMSRSSGKDIVFRMDLDTTTARALVDFMAGNTPTIALEKGRLKIQNEKGQDMLIERNALPVSAPVVLFTSDQKVSWNIRKSHKVAGPVTIGEACEAISQDVKEFHDPLFKEDGKGGFASVSGVPFGLTGILGWVAFLEYGGRIYSEVSADLLKQPIGNEGFTIHLVDLNDPKNIKDPKLQEAITKHYRKAAENGDAKAQLILGSRYRYGLGVEKDEKQGVYWYRKAAEQGNAHAQYYLGLCCYYGIGVEKDPEQAVAWFRKAAKQENVAAQHALGVCYHDGVGVEKDLTQAVFWCRKAAEHGYAESQNLLGVCYHEGDGVDKDQKQAVYWYRKAADQGHAKAQYNLGVCYACGIGDVAASRSEAVKWYRKAANQGVPQAQAALGDCYRFESGVEKDLTQALYWYRMAAEQEHVGAQATLGDCYYSGIGVAVDQKQAVSWYRKAAEHGYARAQYLLGVCYYSGGGVAIDREQAIYWYRKAAEQGHEEAKKALKELQ